MSEPRTGPPPTPRWVVAFLAVAGLALALFVLAHLLGYGLGAHLHG